MFEGKVEKSTGGGIEIATGDGFVVKADVADAPPPDRRFGLRFVRKSSRFQRRSRKIPG
jgi:hypothetical protein